MTVTIAGTTGTTQPTATCTTNLVLTGSSSGTTTVQAAATASGTITVPAGTGTIAVNGVSSNLVTGTPTSITNGSTSTPITGIPSWARRVIVTGIGVTKINNNLTLVQLGTSGGFTTSGYATQTFYIAAGNTNTSTAGFPLLPQTAALAGSTPINFVLTLTLNNASTNQWVGTTNGHDTTNNYSGVGMGTVTLSGVLTQIRVISSTSTDTFSAGTVNVSWE